MPHWIVPAPAPARGGQVVGSLGHVVVLARVVGGRCSAGARPAGGVIGQVVVLARRGV